MSGFRAVNTTLTVAEPPPRLEETTPTTPRPTKFTSSEESNADTRSEDISMKTPTKDHFGGIAGQRALPAEPLTSVKIEDQTARNGVSRENSHRSTKSLGSVEDVEMRGGKEGKDGSDNESVQSDTRPSKKKKGQRFFCTDFPPCQLSFTRSEHLARHIRLGKLSAVNLNPAANKHRKHTGERPFQCHCSRRFSRLDNLRQHAQTVHVNEDIPGDSLAATGTRFQRQIRTDRVRPPTGRSRASTLGSQGSHNRGHSRNLSTSSITSVSTTSSFGGEDVLHRPTSLAMAGDSPHRGNLRLDTFNPATTASPSCAPQYYPVGGQSPSGYSTPTSTTFSRGTGSPQFSSGLQSPISTVPRTLALGSRTPGRRLSVPSANPFHVPPGSSAHPPLYVSNIPSNAPSGQSSIFASPTNAAFSDLRRDSAVRADDDWRRRTWHPGTSTGLRPATSGLSIFQTPDSPMPQPVQQGQPGQVTRLPGIESFDQAPPQPSLVRRQPSPMQLDPPSRPSQVDQLAPPTQHRLSWSADLQRGINKLDLTNSTTPPKEAAQPQWNQYSNPPPVITSRQGTTPNPSFQAPPMQSAAGQPAQAPPPNPNGERLRFSEPFTPRKNKRHAWYNGPVAQSTYQNASLRTSPEDSGSSDGVPTPSNSSHSEYHPAIMHPNGYVEQQPSAAYPPEYQHKASGVLPNAPQPPMQAYQPHAPQQAAFALQAVQERQLPDHYVQPAYQHQPSQPVFGAPGGLTRLDALVAVATGEGQAAAARP